MLGVEGAAGLDVVVPDPNGLDPLDPNGLEELEPNGLALDGVPPKPGAPF